MAVIALLVALGGKFVLLALGRVKLLGALMAAGGLLAALGYLRRAYDPADPSARVNVTRAGAYVCTAALALLAILAPAKFVLGACIVMAEVALAFDFIATAARGRRQGG